MVRVVVYRLLSLSPDIHGTHVRLGRQGAKIDIFSCVGAPWASYFSVTSFPTVVGTLS